MIPARPPILYDHRTGNIWYDADGVGGVAAKLFATVAANYNLTAADFFRAAGMAILAPFARVFAQARAYARPLASAALASAHLATPARHKKAAKS